MSTTHNVRSGDTFDSIAREAYGTETESAAIARANPGVQEPLTAGTLVIVPGLPDAPQGTQQNAPSDSEDEVAVLIDDVRFRFWDSMNISRSIDSMDTVSFGAPFDDTAPGFRELFRPFSFKPITVTVGGEPLFTGTMVGVDPVLEPSRRSIAISGYGLPGVLNDCTPPASTFPLEFNGQTLKEIASCMAAPFGVGVEFAIEEGPVFDRVASDPSKKVLAFLTGLAKQRNLVMSSTARGKLLFSQSVTPGTPVARLRQGESPLLTVSPSFNPQRYHSHITGMQPTSVGSHGTSFTARNPRLEGVVRPLTVSVQDTIGGDVQPAVEASLGRMFGNIASYTATVDTWRDPSGELWAPNTTITLLAPGAMVYSEYEFIVRSVGFSRNRAEETAVLNLVMPGSFSGQVPETLPWD